MTSLRKDVPESFDSGEPWMERMMNMKGLVSDFHHLYVVPIGNNDKPFDKTVKTFSNDMVDEWYDTCLVPNADSEKKMTSQEMTDRWYSFFEAIQTRLAMKNWYLGFHPTEDQENRWLKLFFEEDFEKLVGLGARAIRDGFTILIAAYDDWFVKEKWKLCFSKSDPNEWYRLYLENKELFTREHSPFDMEVVREKMGAIVNFANEPGPKKDDMMGRVNIPQ